MFFMAVIQEVILFGLETLVLLAAIGRTVEWTHTRFMRQTTGNQEQKKAKGTWVVS